MDPYARVGSILDYKSKKFVVSVLLIALLIVVLVVTVIFLALGLIGRNQEDASRGPCWPRPHVPHQDLTQLRNIKTANNTSLATMAAYIQLFDGKSAGFIPLELERIEFVPGSTDNDSLVLASDCADLSIGVQLASDQVIFKGLKWRLRERSELEQELPIVCEFPASQFRHAYEPQYRFSCLGRLAYYCMRHSYDGAGNRYEKAVGQIVFDVLEVELEGTREIIEHGQYSRKPAPGGCSL